MFLQEAEGVKHIMFPSFCAALLLAAPSHDQRSREEAAMMRMLTLNHRALYSDRPLPAPSQSDEAEQSATCSTPNDGKGRHVSISEWLSDYGAREYSAMIDSPLRQAVVSAGFDQRFSDTSRALHEGQFVKAREHLHSFCMAGQLLAQAARSARSRAHARQ